MARICPHRWAGADGDKFRRTFMHFSASSHNPSVSETAKNSKIRGQEKEQQYSPQIMRSTNDKRHYAAKFPVDAAAGSDDDAHSFHAHYAHLRCGYRCHGPWNF